MGRCYVKHSLQQPPTQKLIVPFFRTGLSAAKDIFNADDTLSIELFGSHLKSLYFSNAYVDLPLTSNVLSRSSPTKRNVIMDSISSSARRPLAPQLAKWRAIKSKAEQEVMRRAADISAHAHTKVY